MAAKQKTKVKTVTIEQIKSTQRGNKKFKKEMIGLGLNKLHRRRTLEDTPSVRGMMRKARHMIKIVDGDPFPEPAPLFRTVAPARNSRNSEKPRAPSHINGSRSGKGTERISTHSLELDQFPALIESNPVAAIKLASTVLSGVRGTGELTGRNHSSDERGKLASMTRKLYMKMFSTNRDVAGHAAYALVCNSRSHGKGLDPSADFGSLKSKDALLFREGVRAMLKKHHVNYVTLLSANKVSVAGDDVIVEVHLRLSKSLAFNINGEKVILGDDEPMRLKAEDLTIGCPYAKETSGLELKSGDGIDVVVEGTAKFVIDNAKLSNAGSVPITVVGPHVSESRRIPLEVAR